VFHSPLAIEMVGWELCRGRAAFDAAGIAELRALGTARAAFAVDCNASAIAAMERADGDPSLTLPDPVAMAVALDPTICTRSSKHLVEVETSSDLTRGMTVVDQLNVAARRETAGWASAQAHTICWEIDIPRWKALLRQSLA
jgi:purine nucleosidase